MKKLLCLALCLMLIATFVTGCSDNSDKSEYILKFDTGDFKAIIGDDAEFHVFSGNIELESEYGDVTITVCYYNDDMVNINYSIKTDDADKIEAMANDENHSLYAKVKIGRKELPILGYGYTIRELLEFAEPDPSDAVTFDLSSTYKYTKKIKDDINVHFEFLDVSADIPLSTVLGVPVDSVIGREYMELLSPS